MICLNSGCRVLAALVHLTLLAELAGRTDLRALSPPKWCGSLSKQPEKCGRAYITRADGLASPCAFVAATKRCVATKPVKRPGAG